MVLNNLIQMIYGINKIIIFKFNKVMSSLILMAIVRIYKIKLAFNKIINLMILIVITGINKIAIMIKMFNKILRLNIMMKIK